MWKKAIPNTLFTIGIFLCIILGYELGIAKGNYWFIAFAVVLLVIFIFLKIKVLKEIRDTLKKP
jgi:hypothetical protein